MIDWYVKARSFGNCNCDHACPCQFEGLPNHGFCQAFGVFTVDEGMFGAVDLTGVTAALVYAWPGPVFEGGGAVNATNSTAPDEFTQNIYKSVFNPKILGFVVIMLIAVFAVAFLARKPDFYPKL